MVFTTRLSGGKGGRNSFENELHRLGMHPNKLPPPSHPTTCGKVERFHQTLRKMAHPTQPRAATLTELQTQLNTFVEAYNHDRPHRSLPHQSTPATAYTARPKADPATRTDTHNRVRRDRIDQAGVITLRVAGRLHHIGVGREPTPAHAYCVLIQDLRIRHHPRRHRRTPPRELTLNPTTDYQPTGAPKGPKQRKRPEPNAGSDLFRCRETSH